MTLSGLCQDSVRTLSGLSGQLRELHKPGFELLCLKSLTNVDSPPSAAPPPPPLQVLLEQCRELGATACGLRVYSSSMRA